MTDMTAQSVLEMAMTNMIPDIKGTLQSFHTFMKRSGITIFLGIEDTLQNIFMLLKAENCF